MDWKPEFDSLCSDHDWDSWFAQSSPGGKRPNLKSDYVAIILAARPKDEGEGEGSHNPMLLSYLPVSYRILDRLVTEWSLHGSLVKTINRGHGPVFERTYLTMGNPPQPAIVYNCRSSNDWPGDMSLSMTHFISSNKTHAIAFGCDPKAMIEVSGRLGNAEDALLHPLLLIGIFAEIERKRHIAMVKIRLERLVRTVSILSGSVQEGSDEIEGDGNHINPWLETHHIKNGLENWKSQLLKMTQHADELPTRSWLHHEKEFRDKAEKAGLRVKERLEQIIIDYEEKIRECEMKHTKTNMDIALSTKRDGSQMKSIALLTMVFLPATFVTSMFSMTFFQWIPEDSSQTVSPYIWIYFVVTLGLTFMTVGLWYLFANTKQVTLDDEPDLEKGHGLRKTLSDLSTFTTKTFSTMTSTGPPEKSM
ncbi:protein kinase [Colletotrichum sojae]|uniref:Protein kinase n=1 Tax=Colletotrichum sojae TaxID=2175907 RepID=A0A8H6IWG1_9PEZI|nr:protein kinase [Colletotrichum sojae]